MCRARRAPSATGRRSSWRRHAPSRWLALGTAVAAPPRRPAHPLCRRRRRWRWRQLRPWRTPASMSAGLVPGQANGGTTCRPVSAALLLNRSCPARRPRTCQTRRAQPSIVWFSRKGTPWAVSQGPFCAEFDSLGTRGRRDRFSSGPARGNALQNRILHGPERQRPALELRYPTRGFVLPNRDVTGGGRSAPQPTIASDSASPRVNGAVCGSLRRPRPADRACGRSSAVNPRAWGPPHRSGSRS